MNQPQTHSVPLERVRLQILATQEHDGTVRYCDPTCAMCEALRASSPTP